MAKTNMSKPTPKPPAKKEVAPMSEDQTPSVSAQVSDSESLGANDLGANDLGANANQLPSQTPVPQPKKEQQAQGSAQNSAQPIDLSQLSGYALTEALNRDVPQVFMAPEWRAQVGVFNESNRVERPPAGWVPVWATPQWLDHGQHKAYLKSIGFREVSVREVTDNPQVNAMYLPSGWDDVNGIVSKDGAVLMIGSRARMEAKRKYDNEAHDVRVARAGDRLQEAAEQMPGATKGVEVSHNSRSENLKLQGYNPLQ